MTRMRCWVCGQPADGWIEVSRHSAGGELTAHKEIFYICSDHLLSGVTIGPSQYEKEKLEKEET